MLAFPISAFTYFDMPNFEIQWKNEIQWDKPPSDWSLPPAEAHVWAATLEIPAERLPVFAATLSRGERERARRFHFEPDRRRFIAGRGILREILGSYLKIEPARLQFEYGSRGKPKLAELPDDCTLHFNISHANGLLLVAVCGQCPVGVDIEYLRLVEKPDDLVERFFSPEEAMFFRALPDDQRTKAFFNLWTRKEACLKATGDGITERLREMVVSFLPDEPARVLKISDASESVGNWMLQELHPAPGYVAAFAARAQDLHLCCWRWPF